MSALIQTSDHKNQQKNKTSALSSIIAAVSELAGSKKEEKRTCSQKTRISGNRRTIILDCKNCSYGDASITHIKCRENIFQILISEPVADRLVLTHLYERDYEMENLEFLYLLARFIDGIRVYKNTDLSKGYGKYDGQKKEFIHSVIDMSASDPVKAFIEIRLRIRNLKENRDTEEGKTNFISLLEKITICVPALSDRIKSDIPAYYYENAIKSLARPAFSSSRIYATPPPNTEFIEGYEVQRPGGRVMQISRYNFSRL